MKKQLLPISVLLLFFSSFSSLFAQTQPDLTQAGSYMTYIGQQYREITKDFLSYASAAGHGKSARKVENRRKELIQTVNEARQKVGSMPAFEGDKTLRDSVASYLLITYHILNDDYGKIINLEDVAEQSYDAMEAYLLAQDLAHEKLDKAQERLDVTEKTFADKHKIQLIASADDELSKKAKKVGEVNRYHRVLYLIFFKSYKQEVYLMDALNKKDINAVEQSKNALMKYSQEGLEKIKTITPFYGDNSLKTACQQALTFYIHECKNLIPSMTDYYLKEENFNKIKKAFETKREKERTKDDVNQYNTAVNDYNKAVGTYNNANTQANNERKKALEGWNKGSESFRDKHTPKYR